MLRSADPARALCELARSLPASAIIVGSDERSRVKRALFGSVSRHLIREAPCPIIIGDTRRPARRLARQHALDSVWTRRFASSGITELAAAA